MDQESIVLDVDPRSVLGAIKQANTAVEGWRKGTVVRFGLLNVVRVVANDSVATSTGWRRN
jgi:hypothetical protein